MNLEKGKLTVKLPTLIYILKKAIYDSNKFKLIISKTGHHYLILR